MPPFPFLSIVVLVLGLAIPGVSYGMGDLCGYYADHAPEMYKLLCKKGSASTKPAGANSTFSDSFNISSASLPTEPSSYGIETIGSFLRQDTGVWTPTFALVKGFHKFGTGFSTSGNNTFYGNDVLQRSEGGPEVDSFKPRETAKGKLLNLNIGTSVALRESRGKGGAGLQLGLSGRYNNTTATWGGGPALLMAWNRFSIGAGFTREKISNFMPTLTFTSLLASARVWIFELEYNQLDANAGEWLLPVRIWTLTATVHRFTLTGAMRSLNYFREGDVTQYHGAIQYLFSSAFSVGILYNYIPGATSIGGQYYL
ncbi:MAG: hypothetical protein JST04_10620 [Bdellovibrionales bacterium]|nr:hypothetical protein [Bdellovibrionales bacterium]